MQVLPERVLVDERVELGDHVAVAAGGDVVVDRTLGGTNPQVLQPPDLRCRERLVGDVGERIAPPQRQRLPRVSLLQQTLEADRVDLAAHERELVPASASRDLCAVTYERPAQVRDVELDELWPARRRTLAPQADGQAVGRHGVPDLEREHSQHGALLARAERDGPVIEAGLDRPEEKKVHAGQWLG